MSERLRTLPATVPLLLQHILGTLEQEHGPDVLPQALATLEVTRSGQYLEWARGLYDLQFGWGLSKRYKEGLGVMGVGTLRGLGPQRAWVFRSDRGPVAWSVECLADTSQGDQDLGRSSGCW